MFSEIFRLTWYKVCIYYYVYIAFHFSFRNLK